MSCTGYCSLGLYPVLFTVCSTITIAITYAIAVSNGHVYPYLPAISDTGGIKPESNVFRFLLSCCGFLGLVVMMMRYYQYRYVSENNDEWYTNLIWCNRLGLFFGIVSCIGVLVVAAFQDRGVSGTMHMVGALCVFGGGVVYCFTQSFLTYKMFERGMNTQCLLTVRIVIALLALGFFISNQVCSHYAWKEKNNNTAIANCTVPKWRPECPGFAFNVATNASEWAMALTLFSYFLTYYHEFNNLRMTFNFKRHSFTMLVPSYTSNDSSDGYIA